MAVTTETLRRYLRLPPPPAAPAAAGTGTAQPQDGTDAEENPAAEAATETAAETAPAETAAQPESDDPELKAYLDAAVALCTNAGVAYRENDPLYDLLILKLAAQEYDNRAMGNMAGEPDKAEEARQRMLNAFVLNLRYAAAPDTGASEP